MLSVCFAARNRVMAFAQRKVRCFGDSAGGGYGGIGSSSISTSALFKTTDDSHSIYQFKAKDANGKEISMAKYLGKVVVIVNVASECGFADSNYTQLKELYGKYKDKGLVVAVFPCNQFNNQEPGSEAEICTLIKDKYAFEPDVYEKINVNGEDAHLLYKFLKAEQHGLMFDAIKWNFTKFLVDKKGHVINRFSPTAKPNEMIADIEKALDA